MAADFYSAFAHLYSAEGGSTYTDNPLDAGGPTKYGVTMVALRAFRNAAVTPADIQNLTYPEASNLYCQNYWKPLWLGNAVDQLAAIIIFDQAVNRGVGTVSRELQAVLVSMGQPITVDGHVGPATTAALNAVDAINFCELFLQASRDSYHEIVMTNPSDSVFLEGWLNRLNALQVLVDQEKLPTSVA